MPRTGPRPETLRRRHAARASTDDIMAAVRIVPPLPGLAVLACRCGRILALTDMHRPSRPGPRSGPTIAPIRCSGCAAG